MIYRKQSFKWILFLSVICVLGMACSGNTSAEKTDTISASISQDNWPQFRGQSALGIASDQDLPLTWDVKKGTNIRWKTHIPGRFHPQFFL